MVETIMWDEFMVRRREGCQRGVHLVANCFSGSPPKGTPHFEEHTFGMWLTSACRVSAIDVRSISCGISRTRKRPVLSPLLKLSVLCTVAP